MSKDNSKGFFSNFQGDLFGGLTAGVVALPLALAFGVSSGMGPAAGLYGAIFIAFLAALFGGTPTQISGPTAPMTAVSMVVIAGIVQANDGDLAQATPAILTVFLLAGLIQIALGFSGIGKYIKYMPYPVVSGFMTAIGVMIIIGQLLPILGYNPAEDAEYVNKFKPFSEEVLLDKILKEEAGEDILVLDHFEETIKRASRITEDQINAESVALAKADSSGVIGKLKVLPRALGNINTVELILALLTIGIIYGFKAIQKRMSKTFVAKIPATLLALILVSVGAIVGQSQGMFSYKPIPEIPSGFPMPELGILTDFNFGQVKPFIASAVTLAFLGAIDSLLTSVVADNMTKTKHKPNQELIGQGIGNSVASLFGGIPGAGATIRTVVNINAGGRTKLSGMIAGVVLLLITLLFAPTASQIPAAVLAGILMTVGIGVMDYKGLKSIPNMTKPEVAIMFIVLLLSVFWDLIFAVGIGLILAALMFMKKMGDVAAEKSSVQTLDEAAWDDESGFPSNLKEEVFIKHIEGPLFFGYTSDFQSLSNQIPETAEYAVIRMDKMPFVDQSGLFALEDVLLDLESKNVEVLLVGVQDQPRLRMEGIDIIPDLVAQEHIFENFEECLGFIKTHVKDVV